MMKYSKEIIFPYDLHSRAAQHLVQVLSSSIFTSIHMEKEERRVNAHSLLGILSLGVKKGDKIKFYSDNKDALDYLSELLKEV